MTNPLEQQIKELGADVAPRITPDHIESVIVEVNYINAGDALKAKGDEVVSNASVNRLTVCILTLQNGFIVTGESACAIPENYNEEIGRKVAYENAKEKLWLLEGYALKQRLYEAK